MTPVGDGWMLLGGQCLYRYARGPCGSGRWVYAALVDRARGAVYPLLPGVAVPAGVLAAVERVEREG